MSVYHQPLKLLPGRAWRTYQGGVMLAKLHGNNAVASHYPEEWVVSTTTARNTDGQLEGLSKVIATNCIIDLKQLVRTHPIEILGEQHFKQFGAEMGILIKLLDSTERLTIQVHPDKQTAKRIFNSAYGKTESWYIIDTQTVNEQPPVIYLGFKPGITKQVWRELFERQDIAKMLDSLHRIEVKKGDVFLVEGGIPHAIGAGCLIAEIQEQTDLTLRVERTTPKGEPIDDFLCHQGVGFDKMFECFCYETYEYNELISKYKLSSETSTRVIGYNHTKSFALDIIKSSCNITGSESFSVILTVSGGCTIDCLGKNTTITQGEAVLLPATLNGVDIKIDTQPNTTILRCFPGEI